MSTQPLADAIKFGDLDAETSRMFFEQSPEAEQEWIETLLTIPDVRGNIVDMKLFPQQKRMLFDRTGRDITVKSRQTRASSLILARNVRPMTTKFGLKQLVVTQDDQTTLQFRLRIRHHLNDLARKGWPVEIARDNDDELVIAGLENQYVFASGQQKTAGRAYTAQIVHLSEVSHWPYQDTARKLIGDITPAVPGWPHGQFDIESTPNGAEDVFYDFVEDSQPNNSQSRWTTHFYPWWIEPRYRVGTSVDCDITLTSEEYQHRRAVFIPDRWEQFLMDLAKLDVDQILWRRDTKADFAKTGIPFEQEYVETLDSCFVAAGDGYFASPDGVDHLGWLRQEITDPVFFKTELPYKGGIVSFFGPNFKVWEPPQPGQPYVGWLDCAGGGLSERSDYTAFVVLNALSRRHVATLRVKCAPDEAAPMAAAIMTYYNTGLLGGERDAFGSVALGRLQELQYPQVWYYVDPTKPRPRILEGWMNPVAGRDKVLAKLREDVFSHNFLTRDRQLLLEMGAFTWQKSRGREHLKAAGKGQKDDVVMAAAGADFIADDARTSFSRGRDEQPVLFVGPNGLVMGKETPGQRFTPWFR